MDQNLNRPKVGVGLIIRKDDNILMGIRKTPYGKDQLSLPGGHVEMFETTEDTARREADEECGIKVGHLILCGFTEDFTPELNKHYITVYYIGEYESGEPTEREPDKIGDWRWIPIVDLKNQLDKLWKPCIEKFERLGWLS